MSVELEHEHTPDDVDHHDSDHGHDVRTSYFVPGEIVLHAVVEGGRPDDSSLKEWVLAVWQQFAPSEPPCHLDDYIQPILNFGTESVNTSLLKVRVRQLIELEDGEETVDEVEQKAKASIGLINQLNQNRGTDVNGIRLGGATLNWLLSSTPHSVGHPSSGGWPVPVPDTDLPSAIDMTDLFDKDKIARAVAESHKQPGAWVGTDAQAPSENIQPQPVNIVILDTAPSRDALNQAYTEFPQHSLLQSLSSKLKVYYAADAGIALPFRPPAPGLPPSDPNENPYEHYTQKSYYKVSDHGLFIAGIIHEFAPHANIYIVEVLNQFGMGTVETISAGIQAVINGLPITEDGVTTKLIQDRSVPLVVNASLAISFLNAAEIQAVLGLNITDTNLQTMLELESLRESFLNLDQAFSQVRIFAAAGNDGNENDPTNPPHAYCPAAFSFVHGVGAVEKDGSRAWYSNMADEPGNIGMMVFGGKITPVTSAFGVDNITDSKGGMLGIYISKFPKWNAAHDDAVDDDTIPRNGWARWSGTSFSTGVMSGMFAQAAEKGRDISRSAPQDFYDDLIAKTTSITLKGEPILTTPQKV